MKFPKFLPDGGTIGFVAPSFGCATSPYQETFEHAQKRFTELGYRLDLGPNCYESSGVGISNTPEKCAQELMDYCKIRQRLSDFLRRRRTDVRNKSIYGF